MNRRKFIKISSLSLAGLLLAGSVPTYASVIEDNGWDCKFEERTCVSEGNRYGLKHRVTGEKVHLYKYDDDDHFILSWGRGEKRWTSLPKFPGDGSSSSWHNIIRQKIYSPQDLDKYLKETMSKIYTPDWKERNLVGYTHLGR